jgi:hypothetical protein
MIGLKEILNSFNSLIGKHTAKEQDVPSPLILLGASNKNGLSQSVLAESIKKRLPEVGIPIGNLADGSENVFEKFVDIMCDEIIKHIKENGKITTVVPLGVNVTVTGANAGGAVVSQGTTISNGVGKGIIQ